jgi:two-component system, LytTR family, response regulator
LNLRVLIADDETSARRRLLQFIAEEPDLVVAAECRNGQEAIGAIRQHAPDLVFLDVQMPELSGLDVIGQIGVEQMPATILVTAFDQYAMTAYDANVIDYLLKPFDKERFAQALQKAYVWIHSKNLNRPSYPDRLLVKSGESQQVIKTADIMYISAEGNYIRLHTTQGCHLMRERMVGIVSRYRQFKSRQ